MQPSKNMSHATMRKYEPCNYANHAKMPKGDLGCPSVLGGTKWAKCA